MSKLHAAALVALLALPWSATFAQSFARPSGVSPRGIEGRATEADVYHCQGAPGGSRVRPNCEVETETASFEMEQRLRIALKSPELPGAQCGATTTTQYEQLDTVARVSGTLEIRDCAAASGAFKVAVRVKDENGEEKPLEFAETWERSGAEDVTFMSEYPIGENMELINVRLRGLSCTCADAVVDEPAPLAAGE